MQPIVFYADASWESPYVCSVYVALKEKNLPFEARPLDLHRGDQLQERFRALSLTARVPCIEHGDFALSESLAIHEYLDDTFPEPRLLPTDVRERARARQVLGWLRSDLMPLREDRPTTTMFYARADNLSDYLQVVSTRLGSLSQRLSASVGQLRLDTDLAGDANAQQSRPSGGDRLVRTSWTQIDDVFYEARGYTWAVLQQLHAMQRDFAPVLRDKNAQVSLQQVVRELEEAQKGLGSPVVLNGTPFGFFANHSLVMANYVSRANAAILDLRKLLERG